MDRTTIIGHVSPVGIGACVSFEVSESSKTRAKCFQFNVWTFIFLSAQTNGSTTSVFAASVCFLCLFDALFLLHMLMWLVVDIFQDDWDFMLYYLLKSLILMSVKYHVFLAEQSLVGWFFRADSLLAFARDSKYSIL